MNRENTRKYRLRYLSEHTSAVNDPHTANDSENGPQNPERKIEMAWTHVTGSWYKVVTITTSILKTK